MMAAKTEKDQSMLWGWSIDFWDLWGIRLLFIGALVGVGGLVLSAFSAYVLYRVADISQKDLLTASETFKIELAHAQEALEVARNEAKQIDTNLLREQRLTSVERWRLGHLERAVLPRSQFIDWSKLEGELRNGGFDPVNLAVVQWPEEAKEFGIRLMVAMQAAGVLKRYIELPFSTSRYVPFSSSGSLLVAASGASPSLGQLLWSFGIAGGQTSKVGLPPEWDELIPDGENSLLVLENGRWASPMDGQAGEGLDERSRPLPP